MATYAELAKQVLDWSNRDTDVLSYATIKKCLEYAADDAYRTLRIAPMENTVSYTIDSDEVSLNIPGDLIEVIQLRLRDSNSVTNFITLTSKSDIRSFYNEDIKLYGDYSSSDYVFTRERNKFLVYPETHKGDIYELYYYRRLVDVDARFNPVTNTKETNSDQYYATTKDDLMDLVEAAEGDDIFMVDPDLEGHIVQETDSDWFLGKETSNWLRDENEKVYLWGALARAFIYLQEPEGFQQYDSLFKEEIAELNNEDKMRMTRSGSAHVHFSGNGLI